MPSDNRTEEQKMLEKPVRGYQLRELTNAVNDYKITVDKRLEEIVNNVKGVATVSDLEKAKKDMREEFEEKIDEAVKQINLKYDPTYKGIWYVVGGIVLGLIGIVINNFWGTR